MAPVFADSRAWFAAISVGDKRHERATQLLRAHRVGLVAGRRSRGCGIPHLN